MKHFRSFKLKFTLIYIVMLSVFLVGCKSKESDKKVDNKDEAGYISYADDVAFMKDYIDVLELTDASGKAKVAVSKALQGRVMTSSSSNNEGRSYGWINRALFKSKDTLEHINVFGGEERFWIGPEGGQFSIFFKKGSAFTLDDWYTPKLIDLEPFDVEKSATNAVTFSKKASLVNYSGFKFDFGIEREVKVLSTQEITKALGVELNDEINVVAYQTTNSLTNLGDANWEKETGLLSIWLLGMFNPSPETTIVIPYISGDEVELGIPVNDDYFGKVPSERLIVKENTLYFQGDGEFRSKIGLSPKRAKNVLGSYDALSKTLTIVKYNKPEAVTDYVNSLWELQDKPYSGDVVNSYNDGAPKPGEKPLGPFYELETSSPALNLKVGERGVHIQLTSHFEGSTEQLTKISEKVLGVSISEINNVFNLK
ncbi:DUF6786 family protein [Mariniflexile sp. AS56]|uniref:DUF6786 family protein n=1 Tax=Mariniflexile sp. AS56 TaxID=3063957 RepID=UPI0026EB9E99|nr:DUF6786 family protein [Mariniflexile sp. AS56]MDO7172369.1 hypothetical protein [Mariniflexile sp. AS56]